MNLGTDPSKSSGGGKDVWPGCIHELHLDGIKATDGDAAPHPEAYYKLNQLPYPADDGRAAPSGGITEPISLRNTVRIM